MQVLCRLNIAAACVHAAAAVGFGVFLADRIGRAPGGGGCGGAPQERRPLLPLTLYTHAGGAADAGGDSAAALPRARVTVPEAAVAAAVVAFFAVTAAAHAAYAGDSGGFYSRAVLRGNSWFRWVEYSVTATIMTVVIALTAGVRDLYAVVCLAVLTVVIMATGQWHEREAAAAAGGATSAAAIAPLAVGFAALAAIWVVVVSSYSDRKADTDKAAAAAAAASGSDAAAKATIPSWVIFAVITTLVFFSAFGAVPIAAAFFGRRVGHVAWHPTSEKIYIILSFAAKATLASFLAYGFAERVEAAADEAAAMASPWGAAPSTCGLRAA